MGKTILLIRLTPGSKHTGVDGLWNNTHWRIYLQAPAVDGKANRALIEFLAEELNIPKSKITITAGHTTRMKRVEILGNIIIPWKK